MAKAKKAAKPKSKAYLFDLQILLSAPTIKNKTAVWTILRKASIEAQAIKGCAAKCSGGKW